MRIKATLVIGMRDALGFGHRFTGGHDGAGPAKIQQDPLKLRFKIESMPQHQIGARHGHDVAAGLPIGMRVHTGSHQRLDRHKVAANLTGGIGNHAGRGNDIQRRTLRRDGAGNGKGCSKNSQQVASVQDHQGTLSTWMDGIHSHVEDIENGSQLCQ